MSDLVIAALGSGRRLLLYRHGIIAEMSAEDAPSWPVLVIGGGAAVGKTTAARAVGARYGLSVLPVDAFWLALKATTSADSHPELHYFDPSDSELSLPPERLCDRHIASAEAISHAMDSVIEYFLWERWRVVLEGAWITPAEAGRWTRQYEALRAVFIHEPDIDEVLAAMLARSGKQEPTRRKRVLAEVCWLFGNWVREQAMAEGLPVVDARPRATLPKRVLAVIGVG